VRYWDTTSLTVPRSFVYYSLCGRVRRVGTDDESPVCLKILLTATATGNDQDWTYKWRNGGTILIYFNLTSVNLNCPWCMRSDYSMWPVVVYYSCMYACNYVSLAIFRHREGDFPVTMVTPRVTPRGLSYACNHARTNHVLFVYYPAGFRWLLLSLRCGDVSNLVSRLVSRLD
jgi:hypothetical protein